MSLRDSVEAKPDPSRIKPVLLIVANGFLILVALSALVRVWFGRIGGA